MNIDSLSSDNWTYLQTFLPEGWKDQMKKLGVLKFGKKFIGDEGASNLLRTLLIHLGGNYSLRSTCTIAREGDIVDISDVALLKRLKKSGEWFNWMTRELLTKLVAMKTEKTGLHDKYNFRFIDGSIVNEPGATGSTWRLHYSMNASTMMADEIIVGSNKIGESLCNFLVKENDVLVGDRAYGTRRGVSYLDDHDAFSLVRFSPSQLPLHDASGNAFKLLNKLRKLSVGEVGEYNVLVHYEDKKIKGRICAVKKDKDSADLAIKKALRTASRQGRKKVRESTLEYAEYILIFTTLPEDVCASKVLDIYRFRWQIELVFKRLKSIISAAPLHKKEESGMLGWLNGKVFTATLIEYMIRCSESFFPWGYPIRSNELRR